MDSKNRKVVDGEEMDIVGAISCALNRLCSETEENLKPSRNNREMPGFVLDLERFTSLREPNITIDAYVERLHEFTGCSPECWIMSVVYLDRLIEKYHGQLEITRFSIHRLILTSLVLAIKFHEDEHNTNARYGQVGGISCLEMNLLESELYRALDYALFVEPAVYYHYKQQLISHLINLQNAISFSSSSAQLSAGSETAIIRVPLPDIEDEQASFPCKVEEYKADHFAAVTSNLDSSSPLLRRQTTHTHSDDVADEGSCLSTNTTGRKSHSTSLSPAQADTTPSFFNSPELPHLFSDACMLDTVSDNGRPPSNSTNITLADLSPRVKRKSNSMPELRRPEWALKRPLRTSPSMGRADARVFHASVDSCDDELDLEDLDSQYDFVGDSSPASSVASELWAKGCRTTHGSPLLDVEANKRGCRQYVSNPTTPSSLSLKDNKKNKNKKQQISDHFLAEGVGSLKLFVPSTPDILEE